MNAIRLGFIGATLLFLNAIQPAFSQNGVKIAATSATADLSAMLDVASTTKGVLIPRMTTANRTAISLPASGLLVYQTDGTPGFYYNAGTPASPNWIILSAGALSGIGTANYISKWTAGSTLGNSIVFDNGTNVGIGTSDNTSFNGTGDQKPLVVASADASTTVANNDAGIVVRNTNTTTNNTSAIHFAAANGALSGNMNPVDASIVAIHGARTSGQYQTGQLAFLTSTAVNTAPSEKMRLDNNGNLGIGTTTPGAKLTISGTVTGYGAGEEVNNHIIRSGSHTATGSNITILHLPGAIGTLRIVARIPAGTAYTTEEYRVVNGGWNYPSQASLTQLFTVARGAGVPGYGVSMADGGGGSLNIQIVAASGSLIYWSFSGVTESLSVTEQ